MALADAETGRAQYASPKSGNTQNPPAQSNSRPRSLLRLCSPPLPSFPAISHKCSALSCNSSCFVCFPVPFRSSHSCQSALIAAAQLGPIIDVQAPAGTIGLPPAGYRFAARVFGSVLIWIQIRTLPTEYSRLIPGSHRHCAGYLWCYPFTSARA